MLSLAKGIWIPRKSRIEVAQFKWARKRKSRDGGDSGEERQLSRRVLELA